MICVSYVLPFALLGSTLVAAACATFFILPANYDEEERAKLAQEEVANAGSDNSANNDGSSGSNSVTR